MLGDISIPTGRAVGPLDFDVDEAEEGEDDEGLLDPRLETLRSLDQDIKSLILKSIEKSKRSYERAWGLWSRYMKTVERRDPRRVYDGQPELWEELADEWSLMRFARWLSKHDLKPSTVAQYVSMARTWHLLSYGVAIAGSLPRKRLSKVLKGLAEAFPVRKRDRFPWVTQYFSRLRAAPAWYSPLEINYSACKACMFCGLLRSVESLDLTRDKVSFDVDEATGKPTRSLLKVAPRKQGGLDQYNEDVAIVSPFDEDANVNMCRELWELFIRDPVPRHEWSRTPLFRDVARGPRRFITPSRLLGSIRKDAMFLGVDPKVYGTHSMRIGGASALLAAGATPEVIKAMGRWSSDIYRLYTRANGPDLLKWAKVLGRTETSPAQVMLKMKEFELPLEGEASWSAEYDEVAKKFVYCAG